MGKAPLRHPLISGAVALLLIAASVACTGPSGGYEELKARPEASLAFPDSDHLREGGFDAQMTTDGLQSAQFWAVFGTDQSAADVLAFYESELAHRGWEAGGGSSGISGTHESSATAWHTQDTVFRLGFWKPDEWTADDEAPYPTIFEIRLIDKSLDEDSEP